MEETVTDIEQQSPMQEEPPKKLKVKDFAAKIKAKYPEYKDIDDKVLTDKIIAKYPVYKDQVDFSTEPSKKKVGTVSFGETYSSPELDSETPSTSEIPTVVDYGDGEPLPNNIVDLSRKATEYSKKTKEIERTDMRGNPIPETIPDESFIGTSKKIIEDLDKQGIKKDFVDAVSELPDEAFNDPNTSKDKLVELYKTNRIKFHQFVNEQKNRIAIKRGAFENQKNANNGIDDIDPNQMAIHVANKYLGTYEEAHPQNLNQLQNIISKKQDIIEHSLIGEERTKALDRVRESYSSYINPTNPDIQAEYEQSPLKNKVDITQYSALKTLQLFDAKKYEQAVNILNTDIQKQYTFKPEFENFQSPVAASPSVTTSDSTLAAKNKGSLSSETIDQQIGKESVLRQLTELGRNNLVTQINSQQYDLEQAFNNTDNAEEKEAIKQQYVLNQGKLAEVSKNASQDKIKFPLTSKLEFDNQVKELVQDAGMGAVEYGTNKFAHGVGIGGESFEDMAVSIFGSEKDKALLGMKRIGESKWFESKTYLPEDYRSTGSPFIMQPSPALKDAAKEIMGGKKLSDLSADQKQQLTELVINNPSQIETVTNPKAGKSKNFFSKATLYSNTGFIGEVGAFMYKIMGAKSLGLSGKSAELLTLYNDGYSASYTEKLKEGASAEEANQYGVLHGGVMLLAGTVSSKFDAVKDMLAASKSPISKQILGLGEAGWDAIVNKNKSTISKIANGVSDVVKSNAKMIGTYGVGVSIASDLADKGFFNKDISVSEMADNVKHSAIDMAIGSVGLAGIGFISHAIKNPVTLKDKATIWEIGDNKEFSKQRIDEAVAKNELTQAEGDAKKKVIDNVASLIDKVPTENSKGKLLTDNEKVKLLYNLILKEKGKEAAKDLPDNQSDKAEHIALVADYANGIILENPTDKQLESRKSTLEKQIEGKDENGKPLLPEKELLKAKAQLEAVNDAIQRKENGVEVQAPINTGESIPLKTEEQSRNENGIVVEKPMVIPEPITISSEPTKTQPTVVPPIPPLTNTERSNEGELRDKGILASMHKSVPESAKAKIDEKGLKYRVSSQAEAKAIATQILEDHGVDIAIEYASNAKLDGDVRSMLYNVSLNKLAEMEKAETNETAKKEIANRYADTLIDYDEMGRDAGRFNSAIFDFYKSPLGMEFYENKKRESSFKKQETKNGKSWNEFYEEFKDEPEFAAMVQAEILKEKMKKPGFAKKAADSLRKKADDILKNGITPDWLKADIKDAKTKGIDAKMVDKAIAKALKIIADAIEVGGNIANVIAEQVQKIKELGVSAKDSEIAKWLYKESGATGMDAKSFQDKVAEKIASLQKSIDSYKQKLADKGFSVKEGEVTNEQIKELEQQLKDAKKAYFEAKKDFPAYKAKMSERYLDRMRKKLKGLNEKQQREVIEQSFRKLAENGALDQDDFREIIKNTLGLGKLGKAEADVMKSLVEDINAVDDARKNFVNENGSPESEKKLNDAEMKALKSKQKLATIAHTQTDAWNTVRAAMQLTAIGVPTILKNFAWNFVQQGLIKFPANAIISLADASVSKAANILNLPYSRTTSLFGGEQGYFFKNMKKGIKEGVLALKYGINSKDYFDKEVYTKPIQPEKNAKDLLEWAKGNNKLKIGDVIDKLIKASPTGYYMEMVSRGLTFFDKPLRYAAEGGTAARIGSKELGLSGQQLNVFTRSPKEYAIKHFQSKGDDIATATKKAESIVSRITEAGDKSVAQQANMLSDAFNNFGRFIKDKTDDNVLGKNIVGAGKVALTPATLFIKTPANVAWQVFNLINPSIAVAQSAGLSANAYRKFKNGDVTYRQDLDRAKDWMGTAAVGVGLGMLGQFLSGIGVVESGEDEDTKKKERDATKQYSKKFTFNYSKFNRYIQGIPDSPGDEDLRIDLSWYAQVGAMMDLKERMRKLTKDEPDMSSLDMALEELSESAKIAISSSALNSASMLSNAFTSYDGFKGYGVNSINTMANIVHPQALAQHSRATLDKEYQIKADGFIKQLDNSFSARSSLYRKVTGHYPPSDIGIWGDEIKKGGNEGLRYFGISRDNKNAFAKEIYDDAERTGNLDFLPPAVKNSIKKNGETVKLTVDAARYLEQQVGLERKKLVTAYLDGALNPFGYGNYKGIKDDDKKIDALQYLYEQGRKVGTYNFYQKYPQYDNYFNMDNSLETQ